MKRLSGVSWNFKLTETKAKKIKVTMAGQHGIPVLDCTGIVGSLEDIKETDSFRKFAKKLGTGMRDVGFLYLINHHTNPNAVKT